MIARIIDNQVCMDEPSLLEHGDLLLSLHYLECVRYPRERICYYEVQDA